MYLEVANYFGDLGSISCSWEVEASYPCSHVCFSHVVCATGLLASSSNPDSTGARERVVRKPKALAKRRFHHGWWMLKGPEELPIGGLCVRFLSSPFSASLLPSLLLYLFFPLSFFKNRISIGIWDCCALVFAILLSQYLFFFLPQYLECWDYWLKSHSWPQPFSCGFGGPWCPSIGSQTLMS